MKYRYLLFSLLLAATLNAQNKKIELINLGRKVNTAYHEGAPIISADGKTLYFFVTNHPDNTYGKEGSQDIWFSEKNEAGEWGEAQHMPKPLNGHHSNEVFKVFPDGKTLLIRGGKGKNSKGFSLTYKSGDTWSNQQELKVAEFKKMNLGRFYGATISSDKKVMIIYMSEKEHSAFSDLYVSFAQADGSWSIPAKLGAPINTSRDEFGPFLAPDDKTMYYSSSRKDMGLGGPDIYKTTRLDNTWMKWSEPVNMGRPINTTQFDAYLSVDEEGNLFVTSAGDTRDGGNLDIYTLKPKDPELKLLSAISNSETNQAVSAHVVFKADRKGLDTTFTATEDGTFTLLFTKDGDYNVSISAKGYEPLEQPVTLPSFDSDTTVIVDFMLVPIPAKPMIAATIYDAKTKEQIDANILISGDGIDDISLSTANGYFEKEVADKMKYLLDISAEGYLNATDSIDITNLKDPIFASKDIYLTPIEVGTTVRLEHIYFDFDKASLKPESYEELDKVVKFMNDNATISIEIAGHTDSKGSDDYNLRLSQERAESVRTYVVDHGIDADRITAQGYGETQPETTNDTEEGRAINRRVVFTVLSK